MLHEHHQLVHLQLLVLLEDVDGLLIVGHLLGHHLRSLGAHFDAAEEFLHFGLNVVYVNVAHDDDGLVVRAIPLLVVLHQLLALEVVDDAHQTDGHALAILRARVHLGQCTGNHALRGAFAQAVLVVHHVALLHNLLLLQRQAVAPVLQNQHARVEGRLASRGNIADAVNRLVNAGVGIEVAAKLHAQRTGELNQVVALEVLRTIEGHVLQEVSQAALALLLLDGAHALGNVEISHMLRPFVVADVIGQTIVELANAHSLVNGDGRHLLLSRHRRRGKSQQRQSSKEKLSHVHSFVY